MYQLLGFLGINSLVSNDLDKVSKLGELSPISRTFSSEVGMYSEAEFPDLRLFTFFAQEGKDRIPLTKILAKEVLKIGNWLVTESTANRFDADRTAFEQKLRAEYREQITVEKVGKMVHDGRYYLPEYITFRLHADTRENRYKIWFSDEAFQAQYDKFELRILPALNPVDNFFKDPAKVKKALTDNTSAEGIAKLHEETNRIADSHPYTLLLSFYYDWINPEDKQDKIATVWTVLLYGKAANNADMIKEQLADYVLSLSDYDRSKWEKILPDLFIPTEFYICPFWTKFSTPNLQLMGGLHSPTVPFRDVLPYAGKTMVGYDLRHIAKYSVVFDTIFKSCAVVACGHPLNRLAPIEFEKLWADYANIYTTSRDFNRISPETQDFIIKLSEMLVHAEVMTPESDIPQGYTRVKRGELYYLTTTYKRVQYVVPLRYNFLGQIALSQDSAVDNPVVNPTGSTTVDYDKIMNDIINAIPPGTSDSTVLTKPTPPKKPGTTMELPNGTEGTVVTPRDPLPDGIHPGSGDNRPSTPAADHANEPGETSASVVPLDEQDIQFHATMSSNRSASNDMFAERVMNITVNNIPKSLKDNLRVKLVFTHYLPNSKTHVETFKDGTLVDWNVEPMSADPDKVRISAQIRATSNNTTGYPLPYVDGFKGPYVDKRNVARYLEGDLKITFYDLESRIETKDLNIGHYEVTTSATGLA